MSRYLVLLCILEFFLSRFAMLPYGLDLILPNYWPIPVNQAICIFIIMPIVFCNLVSIKCIIILLLLPCLDSVVLAGEEKGC